MHLPFQEVFFLFLLLEEELDVHATCGFFDHAEHPELRIQSRVPPFFHFLPSALQNDSGHPEFLASSELRNCLKIPVLSDCRHLLLVFDMLELRFGMLIFDGTTTSRHFFRNSATGAQFLRFHSQGDVFRSSWSIQCICTGSSPTIRFHVHSRRIRNVHDVVQKVSAGSELIIILLERFPPGKIGVVWRSSSVSFCESLNCTCCETCMSSVATKPRSE